MVELSHELATGVTGAAAKAVAHAKAHGPFRNRTGNLRRSIHAEPAAQSARQAECWFVSPQFYALFVEEGTRPHEIWPKAIRGTPKAQRRPGQTVRQLDDIGTTRVALRWFVGGDGTPGNEGTAVFARMVNHPGGKPYPYMRPARNFAESWLLEEFERGFFRIQAICWD